VSVEQATQNFLEKGDQIAEDSQDLKEELIAAVGDVRKQGNLKCSYADTELVERQLLTNAGQITATSVIHLEMCVFAISCVIRFSYRSFSVYSLFLNSLHVKSSFGAFLRMYLWR